MPVSSCLSSERGRMGAFLLAGLIMSLRAFWVQPVYDDWFYLSAPHVDPTPEAFLPGPIFWRPIDAAWGYLMGCLVPLFPFLNHILTVAGHLFALWGLCLLLSRCGAKGIPGFLSRALFVCSPILVATTYSVDSANQTLSLAFGVASLPLYAKRKWLSFACMTLSLFSKESGIAWFVVTPLLSLWVTDCKQGEENGSPSKPRIETLCKAYIVPLLIILAYFTLRITLATDDFSADGSSRYTSFSCANAIKGLAFLLGGSITCMDAIALFIEKDLASLPRQRLSHCSSCS